MGEPTHPTLDERVDSLLQRLFDVVELKNSNPTMQPWGEIHLKALASEAKELLEERKKAACTK